MTSAALLIDAFGRIRRVVHQVVDGLTPEQLAFRVDPEANSIAWLVWHLTRIQDDHLAGVAQAEQIWTMQGRLERFGLPFHPQATGYGHRAGDVAAVQVDSGELLVGYHDAVHQQTTLYVSQLKPIWPASWTGHGIRRCRWGAVGERDRRRPPTRRPGRLRPRHPPAQQLGRRHAASPQRPRPFFPTAPATARRPLLNGAHAILYSDDADATRAALARVLGTRSTPAAAG